MDIKKNMETTHEISAGKDEVNRKPTVSSMDINGKTNLFFFF